MAKGSDAAQGGNETTMPNPTTKIIRIRERIRARQTRRAEREEAHAAAAASRETSPRFEDESDLDHAKRLGLIGEANGCETVLGCAWCAGLPWRRAKPHCRGCGEPHEPEVLEFELPTAQSSAGTW